MKDKIIKREHGYGGLKTRQLVEEIIIPQISNAYADRMDDAAVMPFSSRSVLFTTDSFVIYPLFFPGGDIGTIAVAGTVNDIIAQGGRPLYLSMTLIIEEGLEIDILRRIAASAADEAASASVQIVCGDIKVVEKGKADSVYITTSAIGEQLIVMDESGVEEDDAVIVCSSAGDHGAAVFQSRNNIMEESPVISSDCVQLTGLLPLIEEFGDDILFMRDPTRGGVAQVLLEISQITGRDINIEERKVPVKDWVRAISGIAGLDYMYLPCEGNMVFIVKDDNAGRFIAALKKNGFDHVARIGSIAMKKDTAGVLMRTNAGGVRRLSAADIAQIPRIC